jgi:uncharacterized protein YijF (DUF1287 family)
MLWFLNDLRQTNARFAFYPRNNEFKKPPKHISLRRIRSFYIHFSFVQSAFTEDNHMTDLSPEDLSAARHNPCSLHFAGMFHQNLRPRSTRGLERTDKNR